MNDQFKAQLLEYARPTYLDGIMLDAAKEAESEEFLEDLFNFAERILKTRRRRRLEHNVFGQIAGNLNCSAELRQRGLSHSSQTISAAFIQNSHLTEEEAFALFFDVEDGFTNDFVTHRSHVLANTQMSLKLKYDLVVATAKKHDFDDVDEFTDAVRIRWSKQDPRYWEDGYLFMRVAEKIIRNYRRKAMKLKKHALIRLLNDVHANIYDNGAIRNIRGKTLTKGSTGIYMRSESVPGGRAYLALIGDEGLVHALPRYSFEVIGYEEVKAIMAKKKVNPDDFYSDY